MLPAHSKRNFRRDLRKSRAAAGPAYDGNARSRPCQCERTRDPRQVNCGRRCFILVAVVRPRRGPLLCARLANSRHLSDASKPQLSPHGSIRAGDVSTIAGIRRHGTNRGCRRTVGQRAGQVGFSPRRAADSGSALLSVSRSRRGQGRVAAQRPTAGHGRARIGRSRDRAGQTGREHVAGPRRLGRRQPADAARGPAAVGGSSRRAQALDLGRSDLAKPLGIRAPRSFAAPHGARASMGLESDRRVYSRPARSARAGACRAGQPRGPAAAGHLRSDRAPADARGSGPVSGR